MPEKRVSLEDIGNKIDRLISSQQRLVEGQRKLSEMTKDVSKEEKEEIEALEEIKAFEEKLKKAVGPHPLRRMTYRDLAKGSIGAFFGIGAHFTFYYSVKIANQITMPRAIFTFVLAYFVGIVFMYFTGFRQIKVKKVLWLMPFRLSILYITAITTAFFVLLLFEPNFLSSFESAFKQLATTTLSATIGACTADLIGRE